MDDRNSADNLPITVLVPAKNESVNIRRCLHALAPADRVVVLDSHSTDGTPAIAEACGAEVVQFDYAGGYPKKRQWALDHVPIHTAWIMLVDADEVVPPALWHEVELAICGPNPSDAYFVTKGFHFFNRRFRFGGFSFAAICLFRKGRARFEDLDAGIATGQDMEVHERLIVDGATGRLRTPLIHEDFKGLKAYLDRHNEYSTWEAAVRDQFLRTGLWGKSSIRPRLFGNAQERRRFLKRIAIRMPFEPLCWFLFHYIVCLGFLEGRPGLIAAQIRRAYIAEVRAKMYELRLQKSRAEERSFLAATELK